MDGPGHLLSLKVMRVSRPALASAWQPFYSSSPSFSAHSTKSVLSLQGNTPLPLHPKTLRDLTHASELLTLPSSFGAIQLGETFSSCLCVNNETNIEIEAVSMKVEMQTVTSKVMLAEIGGPECCLAAGDTLENVVNHEIKELGQHVLACTVMYRLPPNSRHAPGPAEDANDPNLQTFRKFYKFAVTNPLSVKTKVHAPRSPSALFDPAEREKIFLEVHIQNLTQEPMWFEHMRFECADGWDVDDSNVIDSNDEEEGGIFSGSTALMQPQDMRQYIYILSPISMPSIPTSYAPGSIIPLGRLDISWRSSFGEPGRLLTSVLSRRIPLPPPPVQQAASALPSYLKRNPTASAATPSRPRSPQLIQSRPGTPPPSHRPGSPFRNRPPLGPTRPQSPALGSPINPTLPLPTLASGPGVTSEVEVNLIVRDIPRNSIKVENPFIISFALAVSASAPPAKSQQRRVLSLVVQHVQPPRIIAAPPLVPNPPEAFSPRLPSSGFSTPSPTFTTFNYALAHQKLLVASPRQTVADDAEGQGELGRNPAAERAVVLPPPFFEGPDELKFSRSTGVAFMGASALFLPPLQLYEPTEEGAEEGSSTAGQAVDDHIPKAHAVQEFELSYLPLSKGFVRVGGLRVLLVEDKMEKDDETPREDHNGEKDSVSRQTEVRTLKEWDIIGEVWVNA